MSQKKKRYLGLSVFIQEYGSHGNAWRRPEIKPGGNPDFAKLTKLVQTLERAKFDFAFFADFVGSVGDKVGDGRQPRGGNFEPLTAIAALSAVTKDIGLVATVNTNYNDPLNLARRFASLDHISGGRVGWNVVSSTQAGAVKSFGITEPSHDARYERAREFLEITHKIWDSWDDGAFDNANPETGSFYNPESGHPVHHQGKHFKIDTISDIARPIQGYPVIFQAGNSDSGREFAAQYAEIIYAAAQTIEEAKAFYGDVKGRLAKYGREPDDLKVTPGLSYYIGSSRQEAQEKYEAFLASIDVSKNRELFGIDMSPYPLDGPLPDNLPTPTHGVGRWQQLRALAQREKLTIRDLILRFGVVKGHRTVIGTPSDIVDQLEDWFVNGAADGFNLKTNFVPDTLEEFANQVIPELQRRGIFRTAYEPGTFRDRLGLRRPRNSNALLKTASAAE